MIGPQNGGGVKFVNILLSTLTSVASDLFNYALRLDKSCQPGPHAVVTVCEPDWKHKWDAYKSFDETSSFNNL